MKLSASAATRTLRGQRWGERGQRSVALVNVGVLGKFGNGRTRAEPDGNSMYVTLGPRRTISHRPAPTPPTGTDSEEWITSDEASAWVREITLALTSNTVTTKKVEFLYRERDPRNHWAWVAARLSILTDNTLLDQPVRDYEPIVVAMPSPPPLVGARTTTARPANTHSTPSIRRERSSSTS
jgi:hypothetical protein